MITLALAVVAYIRAFCLPRHKLALEAVALRQQLGVFKRKQPRPRLERLDRLFWIVLRRVWSGWSEALIIRRANASSSATIARMPETLPLCR